jgi:hypothetical protein
MSGPTMIRIVLKKNLTMVFMADTGNAFGIEFAGPAGQRSVRPEVPMRRIAGDDVKALTPAVPDERKFNAAGLCFRTFMHEPLLIAVDGDIDAGTLCTWAGGGSAAYCTARVFA